MDRSVASSEANRTSGLGETLEWPTLQIAACMRYFARALAVLEDLQYSTESSTLFDRRSLGASAVAMQEVEGCEGVETVRVTVKVGQ